MIGLFYPQGANSYGQLGLGHKEDVLSAQQLSDFCKSGCIKQITGGGGHSAVVTGNFLQERIAFSLSYLDISPQGVILPSFSLLHFVEDSIFVMKSGYHQRILGCQSQKDFRDQDHPFLPLPLLSTRGSERKTASSYKTNSGQVAMYIILYAIY